MKNPENKKYLKAGITGVAVVAVSLLCFFLLFRLPAITGWIKTVFAILSPFFIGAVIAYILAPFCNRLEALFARLFRGKGKKVIPFLSILLALLLSLALVFALIFMILPQVWQSIVGIVNAIPSQLASANAKLHEFLQDSPELQDEWDALYKSISEKFNTWLSDLELVPMVGELVTSLGSRLLAFLNFIKNFLIGILVSAYFLASRKKFAAQSRILLSGILPKRAADLIEEEVRYADRMFNGFLMGKLLDSAIIGLLCFIATTLMGFRSAVLISVIVGLTNIIPFFGPFIGAVPCALLLLLENPMHCLYFLIFIVILQQLDGNVIGPKILGNTTGLSSFWVLFSILLFGGLWGVLGMIVGVPLFAVIYDVLRRLIFFGLRRHGREDLIEAYGKSFLSATAEKKERLPLWKHLRKKGK